MLAQVEKAGVEQGKVPQISAAATGRKVEFAQSPLAFEPNAGQDVSQDGSAAKFIADGPGYRVRLLAGRASLALHRRDAARQVSGAAAVLGLTFQGANPAAAISGQDSALARHSYFPSSDTRTWKANLPAWNRVTYSGLYPGVDLTFYGNAGRLEYDFLLQPGADSRKIRLGLEGAERVRIDQSGDLAVSVCGTPVSLLKPVAYQFAADGVTRRPVEVRYRIGKGGEVGFALGQYERNRPLVIDPVLIYGLDIPGAQGYAYPPYYYLDTAITAMTADNAGNTYVAASVGTSYASTSVMKFDPTGKLLFNVSLGADNTTIAARSIAVDASGDIYLAGYATPGLPTTTNALQTSGTSSNGTYLGFLTVIKADGSKLTYSSYFGGTAETIVSALAVDAAGAAYLTGNTNGSGFPTTPGVYQPATTEGLAGGFVAKLNPLLSGSASLVYSTYLAATVTSGGYETNGGTGIAVDKAGNAYVAQESNGNYPVTKGAYTFDGSSYVGAYVTKLNPTGTALVYSAYLGPGSPSAITIDAFADAYVVGTVSGTNFPVTAGAYQTSYAGGFAAKLSATGAELMYSTYLSGPSGYVGTNVMPTGVAVEPGCYASCPAYISGYTSTLDFPLIDPIQSFPGAYVQPPDEENPVFYSGFLVELSAIGSSAVFSTYLGGANSTTNPAASLPAVALDGSANIYFASNVVGIDAPVSAPTVIDPGEGFLAKIGPGNEGFTVVSPSRIVFSPEQPVNSTTATGGTVELRNLGSAAVTLKRPFVFSTKEFSETDNCPAVIVAGGICKVNVSFSPAATGARTATLTIASNAHNSPSVVALSGTGVNSQYLVVSTTSLTYPGQVVRTNSGPQVITVSNTGNEPQPIVSVTTQTQDFQATSNCPAMLAPGANCQISVVFSPTQVGLRNDDVIIQIEGVGVNPYGYSAYGYEVALQGVGLISKSGNGSLILSPTALNFGSVVDGVTTAGQSLVLTNSGDVPVTVTAIGTATTTGHGAVGDFPLVLPSGYGSIYSSCGYTYDSATGSYAAYATPFALPPQSECTISIAFRPSIAGQEAGALTVVSTAAGSPQTLGLSGVGLDSVLPLTINPATITFAEQPLGDPSAPQTFTVSNPGEDYVSIDRTYTTGDFGIVDGGTCGGTTLAPLATCAVSVIFTPSATGSRTGTLVLTDAISGSPMTYSLAGTGVVSTGALVLGQTSLAFGPQNQGTTSEGAEVYLSNPGNKPFTINNVVATGEFAAVPNTLGANYGSTCVGVLAPQSTCAVEVVFSPTQSSGTATGMLEIYSTVGNETVTLTGTAVSSAQAVNFSPSTISFGSALKGATPAQNAQVMVYLDNTGGAPVTFPSLPTIAGVSPAPGTDFVLTDNSCEQYLPFYNSAETVPMAPGASCSFLLSFQPSLASAEKATLTLVDSAGTQTIALSGTGLATAPQVVLAPAVLAFKQAAVGSTSNIYDYTTAINLVNNKTTAVDVASVTVTAGSADFSVSTVFEGCTGQSVPPNSECDTVFVFHPSATGYRTGTVVFKDSLGNSYTATLAGYSDPEIDAAALFPQVLVLPAVSIKSPPTTYDGPTVTISNTGNLPFTIGTVTGTNISATGDFPPPTGNSYTDCNGYVVAPGGACNLYVGFSPQAAGVRTGSLVFPITYADKKTASFQATLSGTGLAVVASATLTPQTVAFPNMVAGLGQVNYQGQQLITVTNTGTVSLTLGAWTGTDVTQTAGTGGDFVYNSQDCTNVPLAPGGTCNIGVYFVPLTIGAKSGKISVPLSSSGGTTLTVTSILSGTGIAPAPILELSPAGLVFNVEVAGTGDAFNQQSVEATNSGNASVAIKSATASPNFTVIQSTCSNSISPASSCAFTVAFTPLAATPTGPVKGTLSVVDNAPGSPHVVQLSGTVVAVAQELALSQTSVSFGSQTVSTSTAPEVVYLTYLGSEGPTGGGPPARVQINSIQLGGTNAGDFTMTQTCGGSLGFTIEGRADCQIAVAFAPTAAGARNATVTITPATGAPLNIQLVGVGVAGSPVKLAPPLRRRENAKSE